MDPHRPDLAAYAAAVAELMLHLRDEGTILTSIDQHFVATWWERGYPLPTVLRTVRETGERLKRRKRPPRGLPLKSMRKQVEKAGEQVLELGAFAGPDGPPAPPPEDRAAAPRTEPVDPPSALPPVLTVALARLQDAEDTPPGRADLAAQARATLLAGAASSPETAFVAVLRASRAYYDALATLLDAVERARLVREAEDLLGPPVRGEAPEARAEDVRELVRRCLRAEDPILDPAAIEEAT